VNKAVGVSVNVVLRKFRAGKFDLLLVDRAMPEINGDQSKKASPC